MIPIIPDKSASCALIGYGNLLTVSTDAPEAIAPNTYQRYQPLTGVQVAKFQTTSATAINYIGIAAHNIGTHDDSTEIILSYATTAGGALTEITRLTPIDNGALFLTFDEIAGVEEIAIETNAVTAGMEIGVIQTGLYMRMERPIYGGHAPIDLNASTDYQTSESDTGQFLGRVAVSEGLRTQYKWQHLTPAWIRETFEPFIVHARSLPFFIKWRPDLYDTAAYGYTTRDISPSNMGGGHGLMEVSFSMRAHSDI